MTQREIKPITYVVIDLVLVLFTILTVALSFLPGSGAEHVAIGLVIALVKASLVVLFFMHVISSGPQTKAVIVVTLFWLVVVLIALTFTDYLSRGLIPTVPGH